MENFTIRSGNAVLTATAAGKGSPLVFLHAGVADRRMWRDQLPAFADAHRAVAYDRRGFGETKFLTEPHSYLDDLAAVIGTIGSREPAVLVGCSQGGRISIDYALTYPDRVKALVLVASAISGAPQVAGQTYPAPIVALEQAIEAADAARDLDRLNELEAQAWLDGPLQKPGRVQGAARELFLDMNGRALRHIPAGEETSKVKAFDRFGEVKAFDRFGELKLPILSITAEYDYPSLNERNAALHARAGAEMVTMKGVAHLPSIEQPEAFNAIVSDFLRRAI